MVRLLSYLLPLLPLALAESVTVLDSKSFDKVVFNSNKPALVEFYAPWCGHCKNLAPVYEELATAFSSFSDKVTVANIDADNHKDVGKKFGVSGYPTLKWFDGQPGSTPEDYKGGRDLESLSSFITEKTGLKPRGPKKAPSSVVMLDDKAFKEEVGSEKDVLVAFTAPWCGRPKLTLPSPPNRLQNPRPHLGKLASDFAAEPSVLIAKVDAEAENAKATAQDQDISGYPTIKFFPRGSKEAETYSGGRSEDALVDFVNSKAGTARLPGGSLSTAAGTIAAFDSILAQYAVGKEWEQASTEIQKLAAEATGTMKEYYLKALAKVTGNPEYAMKEQTRLAGILKKGGLAPEKIDDLQRRSNVLAKFLVKDGGDEGKSEL